MKKVWITWERQRRSLELAEDFGCNLFLLDYTGNSFIRYIKCLFTTLAILLKNRPEYLVVQNPSLILAVQASILKYLFRYKLIIDRHTNFKFDKRKLNIFKWKLFWCLSNFTLRHADYTIVTNEPLGRIVHKIGGNPLILQDKLPSMETRQQFIVDKKYSHSALFVCTFAYDEPVDEVIKAFSILKEDSVLYISGNWKKKWTDNEASHLPENIKLTGFIAEEEYKALMKSVDVVIVFTTNEYTLTCGAYEALSLLKPTLSSNKRTLVNYFGESCIYCDEKSVQSISDSLNTLFSDNSILSEARINKIGSIKLEWLKQADKIKNIIFN